MIEKVIDMSKTADGGLAVNGENAPIVYCMIQRLAWHDGYNNITEVKIPKHNVRDAVVALHNAGCRVNVI